MSETYLEQKLYTNMKHIFYFQCSFPHALIVAEIIKQIGQYEYISEFLQSTSLWSPNHNQNLDYPWYFNTVDRRQ
jgi:hypothetical protein